MQFNPKTKQLKFSKEQVLFLDTEKKMLPFREGANAKIKTVEHWDDFEKTMSDGCGMSDLTAFPKRSEFYNPIEVVFVDSFTRMLYLLSKNLKDKQIKGYDFWRDYGEIIEQLLMSWKSKRRFVVFTAIDEVVRDSDSVDRRVIKVEGKKLEGMIESYFTICLHTHFNALKPIPECYQLCTNTDGRNTAKSPDGMFPARYIQNDLSYVLGSIYDYYDMANNPEFCPSPIILVGKSGTGKSTSAKYLF